MVFWLPEKRLKEGARKPHSLSLRGYLNILQAGSQASFGEEPPFCRFSQTGQFLECGEPPRQNSTQTSQTGYMGSGFMSGYFLQVWDDVVRGVRESIRELMDLGSVGSMGEKVFI